jgi:hypothetical protein
MADAKLIYLRKQRLTGDAALSLGQSQLLWSPWEVLVPTPQIAHDL